MNDYQFRTRQSKSSNTRFVGVFIVTLVFGLGGPWTTKAQEQGILREVFTDIPGADVSDLTSHESFPDDPSSTEIVTDSFEAPTDVLNNYGQRMHGFVVPPQTGDYTFWIASDDGSTLFLSSDETPANTTAIAGVNSWTASREWTKESNQQSDPIRLVEGNVYYISALMKEAQGGDNLAVRWELPDGTMEEPIPGERLLPFGTSFEPPEIATHPQDTTAVEGKQATFSVDLENIGPASYQWEKNGEAIPDATDPTLSIDRVTLQDDGAEFRVVVSNRQGEVTSNPATLQVTPDTTRPEIEAALNLGNDRLHVTFSEPVDPATATNPAHYRIDPEIAVEAASLQSSDTAIVLETSSMEFGVTYTLTVDSILDQAASPNEIAAGSQIEFTAVQFAPEDIGSPNTEGHTQVVENGFNLQSASEGVGMETDELHFSYKQRTGDFDIKVRLADLGNTDPWAKAGLMARRTLTANSQFAAILATPSINGISFEARRQSGEATSREGSFPVNYPETWLRLKRSGSTITGYAGFDGQTWHRIGSQTLDLPDTVYFGMAVGSGDGEQTTTARFREIADAAGDAISEERPQIEPLGPSSRATGLVISEIMYHPAQREDGRQTAFVEIFNSRPIPKDISGFALSGSIDYTFPEGTTLPGGGFLVIAQSRDDLKAVHGLDQVLGPFQGELSRDRGTVELRNRIDALLLRVEYRDDHPWPVAADGTGHSLVLRRPSYGEDNAKAWSASATKGGSPGETNPYRRGPLDPIFINEWLAETTPPTLDFVELYNHSNEPVDLSGAWLTDSRDTNRFQIPQGTTIPARGFLTFNENDLGFALNGEGESVYLVSPGDDWVVDAVRFPAQSDGVAQGRHPDGGEAFHALTTPTAGGPNGSLRIEDVVINELMFNPISGNTGDEFIELYNRGDSDIDLSHWRLADGVEFTFPEGTTLPANGYLVVAKDIDRLLPRYDQLDTSNTVGNYDLVLADSGERVALMKPASLQEPDGAMIVIDEVTYSDGGPWCTWADRGGSSLELIDPHSDNRRAYNWADSDETGKSEWVTFEHTGVLDHGRGPADELHKLLLGGGECLLDDIEVSVEGGSNLIPNPTFENGIQQWLKQGQMIESEWMSEEGYQSQGSFLLRASGGGDNGANRVETDLESGLQSGQTVTIRAKGRWLRGHTNVLLRLRGNYLEAVGHLPPPTNLGTPGARNSQAEDNAGPAIFAAQHQPVTPTPGESVVVTAGLHDPDGIATATLHYRPDTSDSYQERPLTDNGEDGDAIAGDGVYSATIPGQSSGTMIAFFIEATDQGAPSKTTRFPQDSDHEALVRFGEPEAPGNFGAYRLWFTEDTVQRWDQRVPLSNHDVDGTFVYGNHRAIYNIGARFRGSPFVRPGYGNPVRGGLTAYVIEFPKDDEFLGSGEINLDTLEQPGRDPTLQRERMSFWIADRLNVPFTHQRYVYVYTNGERRGEVFADSQEPNSEYIDSWFPDANSGQEFKIDDWFEFDDSVNRTFNVNATLEQFLTTGGAKKKARYRWNWEKKPVEGLDDDYSDFFRLVDAVNTSGSGYTSAVENVVDVDQWMRVFGARHIVGDWDGYGYSRGKNQFTYLPEDGSGWKMLLWDLDFSLGGGSNGPNANLFSVNDPTIGRMYGHPPFRRAYLQGMHDAVNGPLKSENIFPVMDSIYEAFQRNDVEANSPNAIKQWVAQRRDYIQGVLDDVDADFEITSNNGGDFETDRNRITLEGSAPISVKSIQVNGVTHPTAWPGVSDWRVNVALDSGENRLIVSALDRQGNSIPGASDELTVTFNGANEPPSGNLVISEIMYHSEVPEAEYFEIHNRADSTTFDLTNYQLDGADFTFPEGTLIEPGEYLVVPRSVVAFASTYGTEIRTVGELDGRLDNAGETLRLLEANDGDGNPVVIDEVTYDRRPPWPTTANGDGPSLQLIDARRDNDRVGNWDVAEVGPPGEQPEPQELVAFDHVWKYEQSGTDLGTEWRATDFDDSNWDEGPGLLYVEDSSLPGPKSTQLDLGEPTYYFRTDFENPIDNLAGMALELTTIIDDGAVIYLNGQEIFRLGMPPGPPEFGQFTSRTVSDASLEGPFELPTDALRPGSNTLAVEVHQTNAGSSDIVVGLRLRAVPADSGQEGPFTPGGPNSVAGSLPEFPLVWINEVQPRNESTITDAGGDADPWTELFNEGESTFDLTDFYLTDDVTDLTKWAFPSAAAIGSGAFELVWLDGEGSTVDPSQEIHAGFSLDPGAGVLALVRDVDGRPIVVDYLRYDDTPTDHSYGRYPDGRAGDQQAFVTATPGAANTLSAPSVDVVINEWMALNATTLSDPSDGQFDDWFELYNRADQPADLGGFTLTDDLDDPGQFLIPFGTEIPANGFLVVWADNDPDQNADGGSLHTNFALDAAGEAIGLFAPDGSAVDTVTFGEQTEDVSEGRLPDGTPAPFSEFSEPTPGASNSGDNQEPSQPIINPGSIQFDPTGSITFSWEATPGQTYRVEYKVDLNAPEWEPAGEITADGETAAFSEAIPRGPGQRFYRIVIVP